MFLRKQCDLGDPCGRVTGRERVDFTGYDFIVVGGGSGGAVVASRLSEIPEWKVLLLEAGGDEPPGSHVPSMFTNFHGSKLDWKYKTEPEPVACLGNPEQRCKWIRGKVGIGEGISYSAKTTQVTKYSSGFNRTCSRSELGLYNIKINFERKKHFSVK